MAKDYFLKQEKDTLYRTPIFFPTDFILIHGFFNEQYTQISNYFTSASLGSNPKYWDSMIRFIYRLSSHHGIAQYKHHHPSPSLQQRLWGQGTNSKKWLLLESYEHLVHLIWFMLSKLFIRFTLTFAYWGNMLPFGCYISLCRIIYWLQ